MLKPPSIALLIILLWAQPNHNSLYSQTLNWTTSFSPSWANGNTNGNAPNLAGTGLNLATTLSISNGVFSQSSGNNTPTILGNTIQVAGSSSRLEIAPNFSTATGYSDIVINFSGTVSNVVFRIADIDKNNANSNAFYDRVTITGNNGMSTYNPVLTKYDAVTDPNFLIISGNSAYANTTSGQGGKTSSNATDQRGTITVDFGIALITSVTIRFDNSPGVLANPAAQSIGIGSISFSPSLLPVSFISFTALQQQDNIILKWTTAQEIDNDYFSVERNSDAGWQSIASIPGKGNSSLPVDYTYVDSNPVKTTHLYRLKQVDMNGSYKYSPVIRISNQDNTIKIQSYPNPFLSQINIGLFSKSEQVIEARLSDMQGRTIKVYTSSVYRGNNNFTIHDLDPILPGIYTIEILDQAKRSMGMARVIKK
ncbi:MAG TPA: T9SS type A sorting domain-containing protein [Chitinophagaceae bacterium]